MTAEKETFETRAPLASLFAADAPPMPVLAPAKPVVIIPVEKSTVEKIVECVKDL